MNINPKKWLAATCTNDREILLMTIVDSVSKMKTQFRIGMTVSSINIINAGHDGIYSALLEWLKFDKELDDIRLILKESQNILAAGDHTIERIKLFQYQVPGNFDVVINLKGISAFSYG